jgi:hypothetical protein
MEIYLQNINKLLPVLGVDLLVTSAGNAETNTEKELLFCEIKGIKAHGRLTPNAFFVFKESQAVLNERASVLKYPWPLNMRRKLREEGVLSTTDIPHPATRCSHIIACNARRGS